MKRKIIFADIAINISIITLFFAVISLIQVNSRLIAINKLNNGYYSSYRQAFNINKKTSTYDDIKKIYSKCVPGTILYKEMSHLEDLRGVLVRGNIDSPPIIEGRFFNENDFYKNKYIAVVGTKQKERIYKHNDGYVIDIGGYPYEVIGITGSGNSLLDYTIYVNLDSFSEVDNSVGLFYLDGVSAIAVKKTLEQLKDEVNVVNLNNYGLINVFFGDFSSFVISICIIMSFLSLLVFFSYFWFYSHKKILDVMKIIGMSQKEKLKKILLLFAKTVLPAFFIVAISSLVLFTQKLL